MNAKSINKISRSRAGFVITIVFLASVGIIMSFPLIYTVLQSLKPLEEIFIFPPRFWVVRPTLHNFKMLFAIASGFWVPSSRYLFNSIFIAGATTAIQVLLSSMAAYPFAKHKFPGKKILFNMVILALLFTNQVVELPQYILISVLGFIDNYLALIMTAAASSLGLYLMRQNMLSFPNSIIESARIDGASEARVFWGIIMPSMKPAWMTLIVFSFGTMWNRSDAAYIYSEQLKSLPTLLDQIAVGGISRAGVAVAISVVIILPPIAIFLFTQNNVIETMANSGMKE